MSTQDVRRYKEIIAEVNAAGERLRQHEQRRIAELADELRAADERLRATDEKRERVRRSLEQWWQEATELVRGARWLSPGPMPAASERAADGTPPPAGGLAAAYDRLRRAVRLVPGRGPRVSRDGARARPDSRASRED